MTTTQGHKDVEGYMQAVTTPEQGQAGLPLEELIWLLGHAAETNAVRLRVLQSLQRGLPAQQTKADIAYIMLGCQAALTSGCPGRGRLSGFTDASGVATKVAG